MKDILVCLEGLPSSQRATELAVELARSHEATLVGLAIVDEPDIRAGTATSIGGSSFKQERDLTLVADAERQTQLWIDAFLEACRVAGVQARTLRQRGRPAEVIVEELDKHELGLMGRHVNFLFETVAEDHQTRDRVLKRASKPVIVVPERGTPAGSTALIFYDGSSAARRAMLSFAASGLARDRAIHVATAGDDGAVAYETAAQCCGLLRQLDIAATPHSIVSPLPIADSLLDQRRRLGAGLLVMGAYAHSRLTHLVWGSVTHELLEKTPVPIFLHL